MRKLATLASAALILTGSVCVANAQYWRGGGWGYHGGYYRYGCCGGGAIAAGLIGGALLGGLATAAATAPAYGVWIWLWLSGPQLCVSVSRLRVLLPASSLLCPPLLCPTDLLRAPVLRMASDVLWPLDGVSPVLLRSQTLFP